MNITGEVIGPDAVTDRLVALYQDAVYQLEASLGAVMSRLALGTAHYQLTRLQLAQAILAQLKAASTPLATRAIVEAYRTGLLVGETEPDHPSPPIGANFGGVVHEEAVRLLAHALVSRLDPAEVMVGRKVRDVFQQIGVQHVATGLVAGATHPQIAKGIRDHLMHEGVTGFVDRGGRRWKLDTYAAMVARTTTREAVTQGTVNRLTDRGVDLITISSHPHPHDVCSPFDGKTFSLKGKTPGYPVIDRLPPFHPNCKHVVTPARANLEAVERALGLAPYVVDSKAAPAERIKQQIERERADTVERAAAQQASSTPERLAAVERKLAAGETPTEYEALILGIANRVRSRYAAAPGEPPPLGIDREGLSRVGADVRKLYARRQGRSKRFDREADRLLNEAAEHGQAMTEMRREHRGYHGLMTDITMDPTGELGREYERLAALAGEAVAKAQKAEEDAAAARREELLGVLRDVRPGYGEGTLTRLYGSEQAALRPAAKLLPREWVEASNGGPMLVESGHRGLYESPAPGTVVARMVLTGDPSTALHELVHRMEDSVPQIKTAEYDYYRHRTTGNARFGLEALLPLSEITGNHAYGAEEVTRPDKFASPYMGKSYALSDGPGGIIGPSHRDFYELLTTAAEGIFFGKYSLAKSDPAMYDWALGVLVAGG